MEKYYKTNLKRKPKKLDGLHIMKCIVRAADERFHVDANFFGLKEEIYDAYFKECISRKFIKRASEGEYLPENFIATIEGNKFHKRFSGKFTFSQKFSYPLGSTELKYENK